MPELHHQLKSKQQVTNSTSSVLDNYKTWYKSNHNQTIGEFIMADFQNIVCKTSLDASLKVIVSPEEGLSTRLKHWM